jgi:hypothetical protein
MNEVESGTRRAVDGARSGAGAAWYWFTSLGQGAWMLTIGVLAVAGIVFAVVLGRGGESLCDQAITPVHDITLHDGNQSLQRDAAYDLHQDAQTLDQLASQTTGAQQQAFQALATTAHDARVDQAFHAHAVLDGYHSACS